MAPAREIANGFVNRFRRLLNLSDQDLTEMRWARDFQTQHNGVSHLTLQQQVNGIDVFGGGIKINIDREGRVLNISGEPIPDIHSSVNATTPVIAEENAVFFGSGRSAENHIQPSSRIDREGTAPCPPVHPSFP